MIISRAPFRMSFAGGGSDLREYYINSPGAVLSTSIDKFMYIIIHPYFHDKIRIKYSKTEDVEDVNDIQHPIVRACLRYTGIEKGIEIASIADVPAGTGLGSSSAFTVALLNALHAYKRKSISKEELARMACEIEIEILKEPIGKQDQYASAFGGINYIQFNEDETVFVEPIVFDHAVTEKLQKRLLLFYLGNHRMASTILARQKDNISETENRERLAKMVALAQKLKGAISIGSLDGFGEILHEGWLLKKELAEGITNNEIENIYDKGISAGAVGGKILGAGSGGFILFYCDENKQEALRNSLQLRELKVKFEREGAKIIYLD